MTRSRGSNSKNKNDRRRSVSTRDAPPEAIVATTIGLGQEFLVKLVLEVFGAGGAIWGFSEVCGLRTTRVESIRFWRSVALSVAAVFAVRWFLQLKRAWLYLHESGRNNNNNNNTAVMTEKSPIGIQLSSFFGMDNNNDSDDEEGSEESFHETTALTTSPRSPMA